eukprot:TRINITY_DN16351_c0_g1_i1.p1 TRINITY_DN16351_c0_g1~~TRINITY_DN16351_c0_g1_i1.p1  ORF type:complete len:154 (-),score=40.03 TRINITY_DN16351_c0_g1_i1:209-670(-)
MDNLTICLSVFFFFFFQAEDGIRDAQESRGLGDVYKRQAINVQRVFRGYRYRRYGLDDATLQFLRSKWAKIKEWMAEGAPAGYSVLSKGSPYDIPPPPSSTQSTHTTTTTTRRRLHSADKKDPAAPLQYPSSSTQQEHHVTTVMSAAAASDNL